MPYQRGALPVHSPLQVVSAPLDIGDKAVYSGAEKLPRLAIEFITHANSSWLRVRPHQTYSLILHQSRATKDTHTTKMQY
jgi:hypothetical protein